MMTKGEYWIGDLCYVLDNDWDQVCSLLFNKDKNSKHIGGEYQLDNGVKFALYGTAWGDGGYLDQIGNCYGVDAGVIGCVKVSDLYKIGEAPASGGHIHTFEKDFETGYDEGDIYFGSLRIETDPKSDEYGEDDSICQLCGHEVWSVACHCDEEGRD
jgi:hypothetical protein